MGWRHQNCQKRLACECGYPTRLGDIGLFPEGSRHGHHVDEHEALHLALTGRFGKGTPAGVPFFYFNRRLFRSGEASLPSRSGRFRLRHTRRFVPPFGPAVVRRGCIPGAIPPPVQGWPTAGAPSRGWLLSAGVASPAPFRHGLQPSRSPRPTLLRLFRYSEGKTV